MRLISTEAFELALKRLSKAKQKKVIKMVGMLGGDTVPNSAKMRTFQGHDGYWLINVPFDGDRIVLHKVGDDEYELADVGIHDELYRDWKRRK